MSKRPTIRSLQRQIKSLQNSMPAQLNNSLASLVQGAYQQSNLTSVAPIIQNNIYSPLTIQWMMLAYMYKTHGIIQTAIDMPVLDAMRGGVEIQSDELDQDDIKELELAMSESQDLDAVTEAAIWMRLFGGGALILNTDDADSVKELNEKKVSKLELYPVTRWELIAPNRIGATNLSPWLGASPLQAEHYMFFNKKIHHSRVLTLVGKAAPYIIRWQLQGWGMSEIEKMVEDFNSYIKTKNVVYELLEEAKIDVYKFKGLNSQLVTAAGTAGVQDRVQTMNQIKNFQNAIMLDKEDEFEQKQITFAGLSDVMKQNMINMAGALRIPMTKLFGISASGFNSGEDDIENYNAMVESEIREKLKPTIKEIIRLRCQVLFGFEPDVTFDFKPLRVMSSKEEEEIKASQHNRFLALYDRGLLDGKEMAEELQKNKLVDFEINAAKGMEITPPAMEQQEGAEEEGGKEKEQGGNKND